MAKRMLQGSRIKNRTLFRDERRADGGPRYLRHANRQAEARQWRAEAAKEIDETTQDD